MLVRLSFVAVAVSASLFACTAASVSEDDESVSSKSTVMSTSDILGRAQEWVNDKVPYCGGVRGGSDVLCGGTCNRPAAAWDSYRSDCSGFVSWTWQISDDPSTDGYMQDRSGDNGWTSVAMADAKPGDAFVCDGHIKLFGGFVGTTQATIYEESDCGLVASKTTQSFTKSDANHFTFAGDGRVFHAIRRSGVSDTGAGAAAGASGSDSVGEGSQAFVFPNQQHYMMRGANGEVAHAFWDGADSKIHKDTWGSGIAGEPVTLVSGTQQHVWARGTGGSLEHWFWDQATNEITHDTWATGGLASDPTAALTGGGQHVWATDTGGNLQHWYWVPGKAVQHDTWGSGIVGKPTAMPQDPAQHVFARGTGGTLEHWWWDTTSAVQHDTWGSGITSEPAAKIIGTDQHVFAIDAQGALQHWYWGMTSKVTSHDTWLSGGLAPDARPSIMLHGVGQHVFARGASGTVEHVYWEPNVGITHDTWGTGIAASSNPTAILIGDDEHVFAEDAAGTIQHWWWDQKTNITHDQW